MKCAIRGCGSYAINHHSYERDGSDPDLCDVHYWQKRATLAEVVRARLQPGQYAHIVPEGHKLAVEIGPKPEPPEPRWKVGDKCDPKNPPPMPFWGMATAFLRRDGAIITRIEAVVNGRFAGVWNKVWIAQPPPGERQPWEVE